MFMVCSKRGEPKVPHEPCATPSAGLDPAELRQLLGAPPVLSTENARSYHEIMGRLLECLAPRDFLEQMLIKELTDCTWEMARYTRHKTLSMERGFREHLKFPRQDALAKRLADERLADEGLADERLAARHGEPANAGDGSVGCADAIAVELDHARALEVTLGYHERVDKLLITATARRNNVLDQIERYRDGLGCHLRRVTDNIIDAESNAVEAQPRQVVASLVPSEAQQQ
jgi:hypothetical protein